MSGPKNSTEIGKRRHYRVPGTIDTFLPSVTTILGAYPKEWLGAWAAKMVAEYALDNIESVAARAAIDNPKAREELLKDLKGYPWRKRDEAADHGSEVHDTFEQINTDLPFTITPDMAAHIGPIQEWYAAYQPSVIWAEAQVYNRSAGYAGSFDLYAEMTLPAWGDEPQRVMIDLKTSKSASWETWALQVCAYGFADLIADGDLILDEPDNQPWPDRFAVLWVPREEPEKWQFVELPVSSHTYETFLALQRIYQYRDTKPGAEILLPRPREVTAA